MGDYRAVVAEISGSAHMTGMHRFFCDPDDPYPQGFLL
ncbi:MAG: proline racemase family protein [Desulfohalobiaceae bacterium]